MPEIATAPKVQIPDIIEVLKPEQCVICSSMLKDSNNIIYLKEGTVLYSGMTGNQIGTLKSRLKFPFDRQKLIENLLKRKIHVSSEKDLRGEGLDISFSQVVNFKHIVTFNNGQKVA
jgi:hypothetical protein